MSLQDEIYKKIFRQFGSAPQAFKSRLGSRLADHCYWAFRRFHFWLCFYDNDMLLILLEFKYKKKILIELSAY